MPLITSGIINTNFLIERSLNQINLEEANNSLMEAAKASYKTYQLIEKAKFIYQLNDPKQLLLARAILVIVKDCSLEYDHSFSTSFANLYWQTFRETKIKSSIILNAYSLPIQETEYLNVFLENLVFNCFQIIEPALAIRIRDLLNSNIPTNAEKILDIILESIPSYQILKEGLIFYENLVINSTSDNKLFSIIEEQLLANYLSKTNFLDLLSNIVQGKVVYTRELENFINRLDFFTKLPKEWFLKSYKDYFYSVGPGGIELLIALSAATTYLLDYREIN
jgi:hypothetical protein